MISFFEGTKPLFEGGKCEQLAGCTWWTVEGPKGRLYLDKTQPSDHFELRKKNKGFVALKKNIITHVQTLCSIEINLVDIQ